MMVNHAVAFHSMIEKIWIISLLWLVPIPMTIGSTVAGRLPIRMLHHSHEPSLMHHHMKISLPSPVSNYYCCRWILPKWVILYRWVITMYLWSMVSMVTNQSVHGIILQVPRKCNIASERVHWFKNAKPLKERGHGFH